MLGDKQMSIQIVPFAQEYLEQAASMVAARYRAARGLIPFLPARFEEPEAILPRLQDHAGSVPGVAALREGRLVGYLLTLLVMNRGERLAYVPDCGHAADAAGRYDIYRQMYAAVADQWLAHGCFWHAITFYPDEREALEAWFSVGFGLAVIDSLRELDLACELGPAQQPAAAVEVRRARPVDVDWVAPLELALERHLSAPPVYLPLIIEDGRRGLERWLADEAHALWLAFQDGEAVAYLRLEPSEGLVLPTSAETTVSITGAFTREEARGQGIGAALLQHAFNWARSAGYVHCSVDFESANIPGSRFWLGSGFQPVCHSLMRRIDGRLAWAHAGRDEEDVLRAYEGRIWTG
jgi:GNAT superfamily N-acetyltransferase